MYSEGNFFEFWSFKSLKQLVKRAWERLSDSQRNFSKKIWGILTYKWRWQIALNIPYLIIFVLDRSIPAVHSFNLELISAVSAKLPIPEFISSWLGIA